MTASKILIYLVRRDLRISDNPILHQLSTSADHGFTHLLPVYVIPAHQNEVSGFLEDGAQSPYPEARSQVARLWRCGPHRTKFIAQSVWNMKDNLEKLGSSLLIRLGSQAEVLQGLIGHLQADNVGAVWTIHEEGYEERRDEKQVAKVCGEAGVHYKSWVDEKYFVDDRDLHLESPKDLPDVFTTYRKTMEPLREKPRSSLPTPGRGSLPKPVDRSALPAQSGPFVIPEDYALFEKAMLKPVKDAFPEPFPYPEGAVSAHPFKGGEDNGKQRVQDLVKSGHANTYKQTRNGLLGSQFSTKLSAYLAQGSLTARYIHEVLLAFEDGTDKTFADVDGFGQGENEGTKAIRFELLWRDYMRLCNRKFKNKLFRRSGFKEEGYDDSKWKTSIPEEAAEDQQPSTGEVAKMIDRIFKGTSGMGLIDASQRELLHTGYTSNRARQNVASFLAKHLGIDWRFGAEWYEMALVDYDVSSNWANWQYVSGVGNDPRGEARIFNPVKQAFDYDKEGEYVRCWVPELRKLEKLEHLFQACTTPKEDWDRCGLTGLSMAESPVKKIEFSVEGKPKNPRRQFPRRRGSARGGAGATSSATPANTRQGEQPPARDANTCPPSSSSQGPRGGSRGGRGGFSGPPRGRGSLNTGGRGAYRGGRGGHWSSPYPQAPRFQQQWAPAQTSQ